MLALSGWMKGTCDFRVFCLVEKDFAFFWGLAYLGVCALLLAWVFALRAVFSTLMAANGR